MPTITSHGTEIYYETYGQGERNIVFAHGMGGNAAIWFNQVVEFSKDYRIVVFDHRYFARSVCSVEDFDPAKFPDDVITIMGQEKMDKAAFICQSMGGWTGSQMALDYPEKVQALIMSHTPGVFVNDAAINDPARISEMVSSPSTGVSQQALAHDFPQKNPVGAMLYSQISNFNGIEKGVIPKKIGEADISVNTDTLTDYGTPTLFITADLDILFPPEYIEALSRTVPGAKYVNLGDAGHSSYFETPAVFNETVRNFLKQNEL